MKAITGNTYPFKDQLKSMGGKWNTELKQWEVPDGKYEEAVRIVREAPKPEPKPFVHYKCTVCGVKRSRYVPIYASGECRDCYEERKMGY